MIPGSITNYHILSGLNNKHLLLTVLEGEKSKIKALTDVVSGEGLPPGSLMAVFSLCPHMVGRKSSVLLIPIEGH